MANKDTLAKWKEAALVAQRELKAERNYGHAAKVRVHELETALRGVTYARTLENAESIALHALNPPKHVDDDWNVNT